MPDTLAEQDWEILLRRIKKQKCTPFLGAGACFGALPLGSNLAQELAHKYKYPMEGSHDLARVAQFIAVQYGDGIFPKEEIQSRFENIEPPNFNDPDEPHGILADLPLPIYITTNYDDFMFRALEDRKRNPKRELCRWNDRIKNQPSEFDSNFTPNVHNPVVFHLHGHTEVLDSMVLTEDDYLDFLISISKNENLLPPQIQAAFTNTSLLFMGYRLADWAFQVLFRSLVGYLNISGARSHVSVQLLPVGDTVSKEEKEQVQKYFDRYFGKQEIHVYWGTCREFITDLRTRWEAFNGGERIPTLCRSMPF